MPMNGTGHLGRSSHIGNPRLGASNALIGERPRFKAIADVKAANKKLGHHFFDRDTMKFFRSKIESGLIKGQFFITSEQPTLEEPRMFKVRQVRNNGSITTWTFGTQDITYRTKKAAKDAITIFATKTAIQPVF